MKPISTKALARLFEFHRARVTDGHLLDIKQGESLSQVKAGFLQVLILLGGGM